MDMDENLLADLLSQMDIDTIESKEKSKETGRRVQPCPGRLGVTRADGSCPQGNVAVESATVPGRKCCKWGCGRLKAPKGGKCERGYRKVTASSGAECCKRV